MQQNILRFAFDWSYLCNLFFKCTVKTHELLVFIAIQINLLIRMIFANKLKIIILTFQLRYLLVQLQQLLVLLLQLLTHDHHLLDIWLQTQSNLSGAIAFWAHDFALGLALIHSLHSLPQTLEAAVMAAVQLREHSILLYGILLLVFIINDRLWLLERLLLAELAALVWQQRHFIL